MRRTPRTLLRKATRQTVAVAFFIGLYTYMQAAVDGRVWAIALTGLLWTAGIFALVKTYRETSQSTGGRQQHDLSN